MCKCKTFIILVVSIVCQISNVECVKKTFFPIGGLFFEEFEASVFHFALKKRTSENLKFVPRDVRPTGSDTYTLLKNVCMDTQNDDDGWGVLVDGGPLPGSCNAFCQMCKKLNIPQLFISWRPPELSASTSDSFFGLSYYPQPSLISRAYAALIKRNGWRKFTLLYEDGGGLIRLQEIMKSRPIKAKPLTVRRLNPDGDNKALFKSLLKEECFVIDCDSANIIKYLDEITAVNNHTIYQQYILTSLDAHTVDLRYSQKFEGNVSTLHLTNRDEPFWAELKFDSKNIKLQTALAVDAATHATKAIEEIIKRNNPKSASNFVPLPSICPESKPWKNGTDLLEEMKNTNDIGLTGLIQFGKSNYRQNIILKYSINTNKGFVESGFWNSSTDQFNITNTKQEHQHFTEKSTRKMRVVSRIGKPYFGRNNQTGEFEGFAVDLIDKIFEHINNNSVDGTTFEYEFYQAKGNGYKTMIDDLLIHVADLAICDLTITSERQELVDFSAPFMSLGISILFVKPSKDPPNKFSFLEPLALDLWLYLGTAYIFVSFVLLICARMSQEDWVNPHPCNRSPEALENIWTLYNCTWLAMGTIMTQGCDILPRAPGSRWVTGMWWFFTLIITSSYTANVSTFVSYNRRNNEITNVKELAEQKKIQYGTVDGQSTYRFFKNSNDSVYKKIFSTMESSRPSVYTDDNDEGRERVLKGKEKFAFFMESTSIEYYIERNNTLKMIGGLLDSKEYGIAMPKRSPHREMIDKAILKLQEDAVIGAIKQRWWKEKDIEKENCTESACSSEEDEAEEGGDSLEMNKSSGIFLVLLAGAVLGILMACTDFILHAHKIATTEKVTWREAIISEWRSSLNPKLLSKPVAPPRSTAPSLESSSSHDRRSTSRAVSVLRAAQSFINLDKVY